MLVKDLYHSYVHRLWLQQKQKRSQDTCCVTSTCGQELVPHVASSWKPLEGSSGVSVPATSDAVSQDCLSP